MLLLDFFSKIRHQFFSYYLQFFSKRSSVISSDLLTQYLYFEMLTMLMTMSSLSVPNSDSAP